jgi:BlaI family transcriptional regulator, penicillinase repressor
MDALSRRERLILDILYRLGSATAAEVHAALEGEKSYSTVRAQLRILEQKGFVTHREDGVRYVFQPVVSRDKAGRSALGHLLDTFFGGSAERMVATLLDSKSASLSDAELERLSNLIKEARKQ